MLRTDDTQMTDRQTDRRQTDGRRHIANMNMSLRLLIKWLIFPFTVVAVKVISRCYGNGKSLPSENDSSWGRTSFSVQLTWKPFVNECWDRVWVWEVTLIGVCCVADDAAVQQHDQSKYAVTTHLRRFRCRLYQSLLRRLQPVLCRFRWIWRR